MRLDDLVVEEEVAVRVAPPAELRVRLVDRGLDPSIDPELVRGPQAGEPAADDGDTRRGRCVGRRRPQDRGACRGECRETGGRDPRLLEELPAVEAPAGAEGVEVLHRRPRREAILLRALLAQPCRCLVVVLDHGLGGGDLLRMPFGSHVEDLVEGNTRVLGFPNRRIRLAHHTADLLHASSLPFRIRQTLCASSCAFQGRWRIPSPDTGDLSPQFRDTRRHGPETG